MQQGTSDQDWCSWVGREQEMEETIRLAQVNAFAAILGERPEFSDGSVLAPGWQWLFFNAWERQDLLGEDGHPRRDVPGSFLPPIPLPRRMWAGSRVRYLAPLEVGRLAMRKSCILAVSPKRGNSGAMCFVTVAHTYLADGVVCIQEEQDIVYREAPALGAPGDSPPSGLLHKADAIGDSDGFFPDNLCLFRYSALTANGHRIHYDADYARSVEGYPDLVVHGPLTATLLQRYAQRCRPQARLTSFAFRGLAPLFVNRQVRFTYSPVDAPDHDAVVSAIDGTGVVAMQAKCCFS